LAVAQAFQQLPAGALFASAGLGHLPKAEDDPVPEGVDQRHGDLVWDGCQALGAGGVRGVDQPLQGLADLGGPVCLWVGLGRILKITEQVGCAELVDQPGEAS
jgi:hypothetical protein